MTGDTKPRAGCEATVAAPPHYFHVYNCTRKAARTVVQNGVEHGLCTQHARQFDDTPVAMAFRWRWSP